MPKLYMAPADLRRWRMARQHFASKWTQAFTANYFGISERTWRRYELGESIIPQWLVRRVATMRLSRGQRAYLAELDRARATITPKTTHPKRAA